MHKFSTHESPKSVWKSRLWRAFSTNGNSAIPYPDFPQSPHPSKSENPQNKQRKKVGCPEGIPQIPFGRAAARNPRPGWGSFLLLPSTVSARTLKSRSHRLPVKWCLWLFCFLLFMWFSVGEIIDLPGPAVSSTSLSKTEI